MTSLLSTLATSVTPVALYLCNEESGTVLTDYTRVSGGAANNGTLVGSSTLKAARVNAFNYSIQTGSSSCITVPQPQGVDFVTLGGSIFFYFQYVSGTTVWSDSSGGFSFDLSGTNPVLRYASTNYTISAITSASLKDGATHLFNLAMGNTTSSGTTAELYIDRTQRLVFLTSNFWWMGGSLQFPLLFGQNSVGGFHPNRYSTIGIVNYPLLTTNDLWDDRDNHALGTAAATWTTISTKHVEFSGMAKVVQQALPLVINGSFVLGQASVIHEAQALTFSTSYETVFSSEIDTAAAIDSLSILDVAGPTGSGSLNITSESILVTPEFRLIVLDETVRRAPSSITVMVAGGRPEEDISFWMDAGADGTSPQELAYTTTLDSEGGLSPLSLTILAELGGQQGVRTLTATQEAPDSSVLTTTATYTVLLVPAIWPGVQTADVDPVEVPDALVGDLRHWVLQDLQPEEEGGIGSYVMPYNPREMSSPHLEHAIKSTHTTSPEGIYHFWQAGNIPKQWQFSGYTPSEEMIGKLLEYGALNRRFYVIDHRNRAWKVVFTSVDVVPRLRHVFNGEISDWGSDYTVSATIMDQNWKTPL